MIDQEKKRMIADGGESNRKGGERKWFSSPINHDATSEVLV